MMTNDNNIISQDEIFDIKDKLEQVFQANSNAVGFSVFEDFASYLLAGGDPMEPFIRQGFIKLLIKPAQDEHINAIGVWAARLGHYSSLVTAIRQLLTKGRSKQVWLLVSALSADAYLRLAAKAVFNENHANALMELGNLCHTLGQVGYMRFAFTSTDLAALRSRADSLLAQTPQAITDNALRSVIFEHRIWGLHKEGGPLALKNINDRAEQELAVCETNWAARIYAAASCEADDARQYNRFVPEQFVYALNMTLGGANWLRLKGETNSVALSIPITFNEVGEAAKTADYTVTISCDEGYLRRFLPSFIRSLDGLGEKVHLHIHGINFGPSADPYIQGIADNMKNVAISQSFSRFEGRHWKVFAACSRFIAAQQLLQRVDMPIVVCDIDGVITATPKKIFDGMQGAAVGLKIRPRQEKVAWTRIPANFCVFQQGSEVFLKTLNNLVLQTLEPAVSDRYDSLWWLDQIMLTQAYERLDPQEQARVANLYEIEKFDIISLPPSGQSKARSEAWLTQVLNKGVN